MKAPGRAAFILLILEVTPLRATTPIMDGHSVMAAADMRRRTGSEYSEGLITVVEKGESKTKSWRSWRIGWGGEAKGLIQFLEPAEVKGVGLLTISHAGKPSEQWFYAPAIDRDRRVAQQEKTTRFLGTHFTYEDMEERQLDAYTYTLDGEEDIDGQRCYKVTGVPNPGEESQYAKLVFWVLADRFVTIQVHGYVGAELRRIFHGSNIADESGVALVHTWVLSDSKREGTTTLTLKNVKMNPRLEENLFTVTAMRTVHQQP